DMQPTVTEVEGVPAQRHELARPQPVPIGDQDHGGVAVAVTVVAGGFDQAVDLGVGEIFAGAEVRIAPARRGVAVYCPLMWVAGPGRGVIFSWFSMLPPFRNCLVNSSSWDRRRGSSKKEAPAATGARAAWRTFGEAIRFARGGAQVGWLGNILARDGPRCPCGAPPAANLSCSLSGEPPIGAARFYRTILSATRL